MQELESVSLLKFANLVAYPRCKGIGVSLQVVDKRVMPGVLFGHRSHFRHRVAFIVVGMKCWDDMVCAPGTFICIADAVLLVEFG